MSIHCCSIARRCWHFTDNGCGCRCGDCQDAKVESRDSKMIELKRREVEALEKLAPSRANSGEAK